MADRGEDRVAKWEQRTIWAHRIDPRTNDIEHIFDVLCPWCGQDRHEVAQELLRLFYEAVEVGSRLQDSKHTKADREQWGRLRAIADDVVDGWQHVETAVNASMMGLETDG